MIRPVLVFLAAMVWLGMCIGGAFAYPYTSARDVLQAVRHMRASFYDCRKPGECSRHKITASGERFNEHAMTAAHKTLPFGTRLHVCLHGCVVVRINDRGPFVRGRELDLSRGAARAIGMAGVADVKVGRGS